MDKRFDRLVAYMHRPKDGTNLGVVRVLFGPRNDPSGAMMLADVLFERGGLAFFTRWDEDVVEDCKFPLLPWIRTPERAWMRLLYIFMWLGALGIMLGYRFRFSTTIFSIPYWFIFLSDKTRWNNHSYLFGIVAILLLGSSANHKCSLDSFRHNLDPNVPFWNYFIVRFQFFILYFYAGLKKIDWEWLSGRSMKNLNNHEIFSWLKFALTAEQIDNVIVHWAGWLLDLSIGFFLINDTTRIYAMFLGAMFHVANSRLFSIGVFPYVCLVTMPIFCDYSWPNYRKTPPAEETRIFKIGPKKRLVTLALILHCLIQCFLPYSHFITKGYNNWTNGLYGYSWDMMVHSWNTALVVVQVRDNESGEEFFINPNHLTKNDRWSKHADMCVQYAKCLGEDLTDRNVSGYLISSNVSIFVDVWCSLNGRFQQRMFDPHYDLMTARWSVFKPVEWLLPLLFENQEFRDVLQVIQQDVYSWSNYSDVLFIADFPGMQLENFLSQDLTNVTLKILRGNVIFRTENVGKRQSLQVKLDEGSLLKIPSGTFHKVITTGSNPSLYMYTFTNRTLQEIEKTV